MAKKKTLEELRAGARARSKRWRDKNKATHRERVLELYGRAKAQGFFVGGVRPEELVRLDQAMKKGGRMDQPVTDNVIYGPIEGYDEMEPRMRGGHGAIERKLGEDSDGTVGTAWEHTSGAWVRTVRGAAEGVGGSGSSFKSGDAARGTSWGSPDEHRTDGADSGRSRSGQEPKEAQTANERATYARLAELRARQGRGELGKERRGVAVEIVV